MPLTEPKQRDFRVAGRKKKKWAMQKRFNLGGHLQSSVPPALSKGKEKREAAAGEKSKSFWESLARLRIERRFAKDGRTTEKVTWS